MFFKNLRLSFFVLLIIFIFNATEAFSQDKVLEVNEELKYEISYGFIKLGYIKFILSGSHKEGKKLFYNAKLEIKSYPEVPFVKINEIMESEMELSSFSDHTRDELYSQKFYETSFKDKSITRTDCKFNYVKNFIKIKKDTDGNIERNTQVLIKEDIKYRDELSWQYDSRLNSFLNKNFNIPIFVNGEESSVRYSFNVNKTVIKLEKFDYDISVIKMEGISDFTGFFGFKGEFLILLSDDDERVPVKAYFSSTLGNIVWELISYKKDKWKPPAFLK